MTPPWMEIPVDDASMDGNRCVIEIFHMCNLKDDNPKSLLSPLGMFHVL